MSVRIMSGHACEVSGTEVSASPEVPEGTRYRFAAGRGLNDERQYFEGRAVLPMDLVDRLVLRPVGHDLQAAYMLSVVASWSYSDARTLAAKMPYYGLPTSFVESFSVVNPSMYVFAHGYFLRSRCGRIGILSFRGTDVGNLINWLTNADWTQRSFGPGEVHRGFYDNVVAIWDFVSKVVRDALRPRVVEEKGDNNEVTNTLRLEPMKCLFMTGHSLGGAIAVLTTAKLLMSEPQEICRTLRGVYTFGQPAVGNRSFAEAMDRVFGDRLYRHTHGFDVISRLPPSWKGRYHHFGREYHSSRSNMPWKRVPQQELRLATSIMGPVLTSAASLVTRRFPIVSVLPWGYSIDDHVTSRYIESSRASVDPLGPGRIPLRRASLLVVENDVPGGARRHRNSVAEPVALESRL